ncbi:unnamed protein product [Soboliphyme baturini]|uniref:Nup54 domain-containing protein n=1 Tax=Soboliphyme baturini TaxID=241478 RepID=A0A183J0R5_9BILA|nr:unnamed protein product [Soboliphyme baturini]
MAKQCFSVQAKQLDNVAKQYFSVPKYFHEEDPIDTLSIKTYSAGNEYLSQLLTSVTNPQLYGDERDGVIARLNQIQAFCGTGIGYYAPNFVGFNRLAEIKDEDGLVSLIIKKSANDVSKNRQLLCDCVYKIMGAKPQISVQIELLKPLPDDRCETVIFIVESNPSTNAKRRVPASEVYQFLNQPTIKSQLQANAAVEDIAIRANLNEEKLQGYLAVAPPGFDPNIWIQAQKDNPKPGKMLPWPIQGYDQLHYRRQLQLQEIELQKCYCQVCVTLVNICEMMDSVAKFEKRLLAMQAKLLEMQTTQNTVSNRLLSVIRSQMMRFREGYSLDSTEEALKTRLDRINAYLTGPLQLKNRITELLSHIRSRPECLSAQLKSDIVEENLTINVKYLKDSQDFLEKITSLLQADIKDVAEMQRSLNQAESP